MKKKMRVMTEKTLNAETPIEFVRTWITDDEVFFKRNQGQFTKTPVALSDWKLTVEGLVKQNLVSKDSINLWDLPGLNSFAVFRWKRHLL